MAAAEKSVSAIIVSWNVLPLLRSCLKSLLERDECVEILVIDNDSSDGTAEVVRREFGQVRLIESGRNLGYAAGVNIGVALAGEDYLLILNPDTEVMPGAVAAMARLLARDPSVGVVAPKLVCADGSLQPSRRRFPTMVTLFLESTPLGRLSGMRRFLRRFYCADTPPAHVQEVDWVYGACLLVRRQALAEVGGMDETFFMYSEEVDMCRRLKQLGWQVVYEPAAVVVHHEGKSSEQAPTASLLHFNSSKVLYARKYFGEAMAELLRLRLLAMFAWQAAIEGVKFMLGHKRELHAQRLRSYLAVLRTGLSGEP